MSVSPCGKYRIIGATIGGAKRVLDDLSAHEVEERQRLGFTDNGATYTAVAEERAWLIITVDRPFDEVALFGVGEQFGTRARYVWFLPTSDLVKNHKRDLANPKLIKWVLDFIWSSIPTDVNKEPLVLFNGVTPENKTVIRWLKKVVGARVGLSTVPAGPAQRPALPFFLHHEADYV